MKKFISLLVAVTISTGALAQGAKPPAGKAASLSLERFEGGSVKVELGYNITLNKESALKREWFLVRDEQSPAFIEGNTGIEVNYKSGERYTSGQYNYRANYLIKAREAISAVEVRLVVIDVFGRLIRTLSSTEVADIPEGQQKFHDANWRIFSENEASEAFASVAYVAQVRTQSGRVYEADRAAVLDQVRKVTRKITEADLEPKRETAQK